MGWIADWPLETTNVSGSPNQKSENFKAIETWWDIGHQTFTSGGSGTHTVGKVETLYYGTWNQIQALTAPGTGAIAYAYDYGTLNMYRGSWGRLTKDYFSRVRNAGDNVIISTDSWTVISKWDSAAISGQYDTLDEWSGNKFQPIASAGYYVITYSAIWDYVAGAQYQKAVGLFKNGVLHSISRVFGASTVRHTCADIIGLSFGDYLQLAAWQNSGANKTIIFHNIHIQRIS